MNLKNNKNIKDVIYELIEKMDKNDFDRYWTGFKKLPFALYDSEKAYIYGLENELENGSTENGILTVDWCEEFCGDTTISFNGEQIGIWCFDEVSRNMDIDRLYASLVHEVFHGNQVLNKETRWGNQSIIARYQFNQQIIDLRMQERVYLLKAVYEKESYKKLDYVKKFIDCRESRAAISGDLIKYENGIESTEGTATYVEYRANQIEKEMPELFLLAEYGKELINMNSLVKFRVSCYYSGLFISIILDDIYPDWKPSYDTSGKYLYEFLRDSISHKANMITPIKTEKALEVLEEYKEYKLDQYKKFQESDGYKIKLIGQIKQTGYDPMNIIYLDNCAIHNGHIRLNNKYYITTPVLTINGDTEKHIKEAYLFSKTAPIVDGNDIKLDKDLTFSGEIFIDGYQYIILTKE